MVEKNAHLTYTSVSCQHSSGVPKTVTGISIFSLIKNVSIFSIALLKLAFLLSVGVLE